MKICFNDVVYAISYALDCVEEELLGVTTNHSKRVAYMCSEMGKTMGMDSEQLLDLAAVAVLHDNALTEFMGGEFEKEHCVKGEENISTMPLYKNAKGAVLYHHENADGSGFFGKTAREVPLYARMVHLTDTIDAEFHFDTVSREKFDKAKKYIADNTDILFDRQVAEAFDRAVPFEKMVLMCNKEIDALLHGSLPSVIREYEEKQLIDFATVFAHIIDCKSEVTARHSLGMAQKAMKLGEYEGFDSETLDKLYFAGALHDIGKLIIAGDVLEKPDKLTDKEYVYIQNHAYETYKILSGIKGMEDITSWASFHHEKLDGSGYPFGKKADELGKKERMMACLDIYQALTEKRSYKDGMSHQEAMKELNQMAESGKLDRSLVEDIDKCFS